MTGSLQQKNGKYQMVINLVDENGKRKPKWISTGLEIRGNKRKAEEMLKQTVRDFEDKKIVTCRKTLFHDFIQEWLEMMKPFLKENTYDIYKMVINAHMVPYFKKARVTLQDLEPHHLQKYYNTKLENGMSPNTILKHHANIHKCLNYALSQNLIAYNPADRVQLPKKQKFVGKCYDDAQIKKLLNIMSGTPIESVVFLTAHLGLRRSEVLGLKWDAVDLKNKTITIKHTAVTTSKKVLYSDSVKTSSSLRTLPITNNIIAYLNNLRAHQDEMKQILGSEYISNDYICKLDDGAKIKPDYVSAKFKSILEKSDLPVIRFHDLRHSAASLLLDIGFGLKDIQEWLGHADITTTSNIYLHTLYKAKVNMAEKMESRLSGEC